MKRLRITIVDDETDTKHGWSVVLDERYARDREELARIITKATDQLVESYFGVTR